VRTLIRGLAILAGVALSATLLQPLAHAEPAPAPLSNQPSSWTKHTATLGPLQSNFVHRAAKVLAHTSGHTLNYQTNRKYTTPSG
jgi:hypothetical protein